MVVEKGRKYDQNTPKIGHQKAEKLNSHVFILSGQGRQCFSLYLPHLRATDPKRNTSASN